MGQRRWDRGPGSGWGFRRGGSWGRRPRQRGFAGGSQLPGIDACRASGRGRGVSRRQPVRRRRRRGWGHGRARWASGRARRSTRLPFWGGRGWPRRIVGGPGFNGAGSWVRSHRRERVRPLPGLLGAGGRRREVWGQWRRGWHLRVGSGKDWTLNRDHGDQTGGREGELRRRQTPPMLDRQRVSREGRPARCVKTLRWLSGRGSRLGWPRIGTGGGGPHSWRRGQDDGGRLGTNRTRLARGSSRPGGRGHASRRRGRLARRRSRGDCSGSAARRGRRTGGRSLGRLADASDGGGGVLRSGGGFRSTR